MNLDLAGANTLLVNPFDDDGDVDERSLARLIDHVLAGGARGIIFLGSTGDFFALTHEERVRIIHAGTGHVAGRVPVTVGVGSDVTAESIALTAEAQAAGGDCVMVIPPIYFDTSSPTVTNVELEIAVLSSPRSGCTTTSTTADPPVSPTHRSPPHPA